MTLQYAPISTKPDIRLAYKLSQLSRATDKPSDEPDRCILIVLLSGLLCPITDWDDVVKLLASKPTDDGDMNVDVYGLAYDRYGLDETKLAHPGHETVTHDLMDSTMDLHALLEYVEAAHPIPSNHEVLLVGHSLGTPLARLYAAKFPGSLSGILCLDAHMTETDFISIYPDPDNPSFDGARDLPEGVMVESLRSVRKVMRDVFDPSMPNEEGLDRGNLWSLLPNPSQPQLMGPRGKRPFVTVVSHEPDAFAAESEKYLGAPQALVLQYTSPTLQRHFRGLMQLTEPDRARGLIVTPGSGHYVIKDAPVCVEDEIWILVSKILAEIAG